MKFQDYPKDLQRIVELTPEGWAVDDNWAELSARGNVVFSDVNHLYAFTRDQYEQCRAQWLAEKGEVDWRGFCEELLCSLTEIYTYGLGGLDKAETRRIEHQIDKARKALEQTK